LDAANEIPKLYEKEHRDNQSALGADDFLPIFIYVLVKTQILEIALINEEIQALCDSDSRMSEAGYYLATLEASIQHIIDIDVDSGELNREHDAADDDDAFEEFKDEEKEEEEEEEDSSVAS